MINSSGITLYKFKNKSSEKNIQIFCQLLFLIGLNLFFIFKLFHKWYLNLWVVNQQNYSWKIGHVQCRCYNLMVYGWKISIGTIWHKIEKFRSWVWSKCKFMYYVYNYYLWYYFLSKTIPVYQNDDYPNIG